MSEDEAFIRAIVDAPGDDLPRLVYADWLDDRDDPRGAYLRVEMEWGKAWRSGQRPGDSSKLRKRAAGLDPVWIARVSRAPMGVCFETTRFRHDLAPPASEDAINALADEFGVVFPPEYRAFLLNYNGGWFSPPGEEYFPEADELLADVARIAEGARDLFANCDESNRRCGLFPIGGTAGASGHSALLGVGLANAEPGKLYGRVYHAGDGEEPWTESGDFIEVEDWYGKVADSLPEWFAEWEQEAIDWPK